MGVCDVGLQEVQVHVEKCLMVNRSESETAAEGAGQGFNLLYNHFPFHYAPQLAIKITLIFILYIIYKDFFF